MSVYHLIINRKGENFPEYSCVINRNVNEIKEILTEITNKIEKHSSFFFLMDLIYTDDIINIEIWKTKTKYKQRIFRNLNWIRNKGQNVTNDFAEYLPMRKEKSCTVSHIHSKPKKKYNKKIFIVHGRFYEPVRELEKILSELGLIPVVLESQSSSGKTIIENLEKNSDVGYAFIILTPDDLGCTRKAIESASKIPPRSPPGRFLGLIQRAALRDRARQNVIFEFGYFIGLLGRDRICCLYKGNIEFPSNMKGIIYCRFRDSVNEVKQRITKELKEAGYDLKI